MASLNAGDIAINSADALSSCDIAQLEDLFAASRENVEALRDLQDELRYRQSPQALALLNRIQNVLAAHEPRLVHCRAAQRGGGVTAM
jgi:hypothetical protein